MRRMLSSRHAMLNDGAQTIGSSPDYRVADVSTVMLAVSVIVRVRVPSQRAPSVRARWTESISNAGRTVLEREFTLVAERHREGTTRVWGGWIHSPCVTGSWRSGFLQSSCRLIRLTSAAQPKR
jgi:hypothetical protein